MKLDLRHPLYFALVSVLLTALAVLSACATKPVSPEDYLRSAQAQVGAVYQTIGDLKAQRSITQAQAKSAIAKVEAVELELGTAELLLNAGDVGTAQGKLKLVLAALLAIQAELKPKS